MGAKIYKIKCLTNLHVGNGDVNFNIVDNEVEKDPITGYPTINASGVKGALREHFESIFDKEKDIVIRLFGKPNKKGEDVCPGNIKILCANMLCIPMRTSKGDKPYALVTTQVALDNFKTLNKALLGTDIELEINNDKVVYPEGNKCENSVTIYGEEMFVMDDETFRNIPLPVVARNCLDEGKENLWYEEIVPHEAVMYFFVLGDSADINAFNNVIKNKNIVQFGGNASIGCGICEVTEG